MKLPVVQLNLFNYQPIQSVVETYDVSLPTVGWPSSLVNDSTSMFSIPSIFSSDPGVQVQENVAEREIGWASEKLDVSYSVGGPADFICGGTSLMLMLFLGFKVRGRFFGNKAISSAALLKPAPSSKVDSDSNE